MSGLDSEPVLKIRDICLQLFITVQKFQAAPGFVPVLLQGASYLLMWSWTVTLGA